MSLIFAPGKYLTLILLFVDIFFSISPDIVESPQKSVVPFLHSSLFCCKVLLSALLMFSVGVVWIPCLVLTCSLLTCFAVCFTSITGQLLLFELWGETYVWKVYQLQLQNLREMVYYQRFLNCGKTNVWKVYQLQHQNLHEMVYY